MSQQRINIFFYFACLLLIIASMQAAATLEAEVDAYVISEGESLQLTISIDRQIFAANPDFSVIEKDFDIINTSQSSQIRTVNGQITSQTTWTLTILPRKIGNLTIPAIKLKNEKSKPISIKVQKTDATRTSQRTEPVFIEASLDTDSVYVHAQAVYSVKLYFRVPLLDGKLTPPEAENAVIESLGDQRQFKTLVKGTRYNVVERKYAIFPQASGEISLPPSIFTGSIATSSRRSFFGDAGKAVRKQGNSVTLQVKSKPADYPQAPWLPAKNLTIFQAWTQTPASFKVGEPITRVLTLTAHGLTASSIPDLPVPESDAFKVYPDQAETTDTQTAAGITGKVTQSQAIIPTQAGNLFLPEINIYWWNTEEDHLETATLPSQTIVVEGKAKQAKPAFQSAPALPLEKPQPVTVASPSVDPKVWQIAAVSFAILWLATLIYCSYLLKRKQEKPVRTQENPIQPNAKEAEKALKQACNENNPHHVESTLIKWAQSIRPNSNIHSLGDIRRLSTEQALIDALQTLEHIRYKPDTREAWDASSIREHYRTLNAHSDTAQHQVKSGLPPLYPTPT